MNFSLNGTEHPYLSILNEIEMKDTGVPFLTDCCGKTVGEEEVKEGFCPHCKKTFSIFFQDPLTSRVREFLNVLIKNRDANSIGIAFARESDPLTEQQIEAKQKTEYAEKNAQYLDYIKRFNVAQKEYLYPNCPANNVTFIKELVKNRANKRKCEELEEQFKPVKKTQINFRHSPSPIPGLSLEGLNSIKEELKINNEEWNLFRVVDLSVTYKAVGPCNPLHKGYRYVENMKKFYIFFYSGPKKYGLSSGFRITNITKHVSSLLQKFLISKEAIDAKSKEICATLLYLSEFTYQLLEKLISVAKVTRVFDCMLIRGLILYNTRNNSNFVFTHKLEGLIHLLNLLPNEIKEHEDIKRLIELNNIKYENSIFSHPLLDESYVEILPPEQSKYDDQNLPVIKYEEILLGNRKEIQIQCFSYLKKSKATIEKIDQIIGQIMQSKTKKLPLEIKLVRSLLTLTDTNIRDEKSDHLIIKVIDLYKHRNRGAHLRASILRLFALYKPKLNEQPSVFLELLNKAPLSVLKETKFAAWLERKGFEHLKGSGFSGPHFDDYWTFDTLIQHYDIKNTLIYDSNAPIIEYEQNVFKIPNFCSTNSSQTSLSEIIDKFEGNEAEINNLVKEIMLMGTKNISIPNIIKLALKECKTHSPSDLTLVVVRILIELYHEVGGLNEPLLNIINNKISINVRQNPIFKIFLTKANIKLIEGRYYER